jgi:hypothetical protein
VRQLLLAPQLEDYLTRPARIVARPRQQRNLRYVPLQECEQVGEDNESVNHPDVGLPHGWHLDCARLPVPPVPEEGPKLDAEIHRRIQNFPDQLRCERKYQNP